MLAFIGGTIDIFFSVFLKNNNTILIKNFKEVKVLTVSLPNYQLLASPSVLFSDVLYINKYTRDR